MTPTKTLPSLLRIYFMMNYFVVWLTEERRLAFVRDPHHRESPTPREQGLNLHRT